MPKLTQVAGFEWGSGFFINPTSPEEAAKFLREVRELSAPASILHIASEWPRFPKRAASPMWRALCLVPSLHSARAQAIGSAW